MICFDINFFIETLRGSFYGVVFISGVSKENKSLRKQSSGVARTMENENFLELKCWQIHFNFIDIYGDHQIIPSP